MTPTVQKCRICLTRDAVVTRSYTAPNVPGTSVTHSMCGQHDAPLHGDMLEAGWVEVASMTPATVRRVPNQPKTPQRTLRVSDELWNAAQKRAAEKGETVSDAVRRFLERYTR